ncbi:MAG: hypothetical protein Q8L27_01595 [archaeon]|nr:hypothetical protein [archaeon]
MKKEEDYSYNEILSSNEQKVSEIRAPYSLEFAIIWTLFFAIIGITLQIAQSQTFVFWNSIINFLGQNYVYWVNSFGSFISASDYVSGMDLFSSIMSKWYYFLYTGGLIAIIGTTIGRIINIKKSPKKNQTLIPVQNKLIEKKELSKLDMLIEKGINLLSQNKILEAEQLYSQLRRDYESHQNKDTQDYKKILDFYYDIQDKK